MKPATLAAKQTIQYEHAVHVTPRVRAEWEYNRFNTPTVAIAPVPVWAGGSKPAEYEEWMVNFGHPDSIALPNRPRTGIAKARTGSTKVKPLGDHRDSPQAARFYPSNPDDLYVYWSSYFRTKLVAVNGGYDFDAPIEITVMYDAEVAANKIVAGFETSYAKPKNFTIEVYVIRPDDTEGWETASVNPVIAPDGKVTLWYGGSGWDIEANYEWPIIIKGVRLKVYSMDTAYAHVDVLQLGARLENDLTDFVINYSVQMECSDRSFIAPLGKASTNTATVSLSNIDGRFNNHNAASLYAGMIDKKVKFTVDLGIDATPQFGTKYEYIREFVMWADGWGGQDQTTVDVQLKDSSVFLQEMQMPVAFLENSTVGAIVWQTMDRLGMTNYAYLRATDDFGQIVPFFWPEDDATVWEQFATLAEATQTAIYFDENDVLQIRARKAMFDPSESIDWNLDAISNGQKLPDIAELEISYELEANQVDITYQPAHYADLGKNLPKMETAWEPEEETVVLRASSLAKDLLINSTDLWITQAEAVFWNYESAVNIRGEILRYKGKEYGYYDANGTLQKKVIYTLDEQKTLDALNANLSFKNAYTGRLMIVERGMWGSGTAPHMVMPNRYYDFVTNVPNTVFYAWENGGRQYKEGYMRMSNNGSNAADYHVARHETAMPTTISTVWYGCRMRYPDEPNDFNAAGLWFMGNSLDSGIFLELGSTAMAVNDKRSHNELFLNVNPNNAAMFRVNTDGPVSEGQTAAHGYIASVLKGVWIDLDIKCTRRTDNYVTVTAFINGIKAGSWTIAPAQQPVSEGRWGPFVRGAGVAEFEHIYAMTEDPTNPLRDPDATNFLDLKTGGFTSGFIQKEIKFNFRYIVPCYVPRIGTTMYFPQIINQSTFAFDEFSPVVHEIREFTVKFKDEARPVGHSFLYISNSQVEALGYESDAFGARFTLANAGRTNVIVKGEDDITFGTESTINQVLFVYGRAVYQDEETVSSTKDDVSIRRRGVTRTEINSRYVQTKEMADELGLWIKDLWATGVDELMVTTFGNPFLQLGDLVTVNYPIKDMYPASHKYFVVSINNEFAGGYTTSLILRRARI